MRHRSTTESCHSCPVAPTWFFSIHAVRSAKQTPIRKSGMRGQTSRHAKRGRSHQMISSSAAGSEQVTVLLKRAHTNETKARAYQPQREVVASRGSPGAAKRKKARTESK